MYCHARSDIIIYVNACDTCNMHNSALSLRERSFLPFEVAL